MVIYMEKNFDLLKYVEEMESSTFEEVEDVIKNTESSYFFNKMLYELEKERKKRGYTRKAWAEKANVPEKTIRRLMKREVNPNCITIQNLLDSLDLIAEIHIVGK